jgi:hypothetical protein
MKSAISAGRKGPSRRTLRSERALINPALARGVLRDLVTVLERAAQERPAITRRYRIAGLPVALHVGATGGAQDMLRAIEPLASPGDTAPALLSLHVWDGRGDAIALPESPVLRRDGAPEAGLGGYSGDSLRAFYQPVAGALSLLDSASGRGHWWLRDAATAPYYERAAPFKHVLQWWIADRGGAMLHSAAVGIDGAGLLIAGPSGSGKSSSALACVDAGFSFASDDYVLIDAAHPPSAHMAYATAKVLRSSLARHVHLAPHFRNLAREDEKPMLFVHELAPNRIGSALSLGAVVLPVVAHRATTGLSPIRPAEMLRALAPSSVMLFPLAGDAAFRRMADLCRELPCWRAELADDPADVAGALRELLAKSVAYAARATG